MSMTTNWVQCRDECGIVTGCDDKLEWMLPWWFKNYSKTNKHKVVFADFGMSKAGRDWCIANGGIIDLTFKIKVNWFKKPLALLKSPFKHVVWVDLDCEIRKDISALFEYATKGLAVTKDPYNRWVKSSNVVAAGVVGATNGNQIVSEWAAACLSPGSLRGDQEVLNEVIKNKWDQVVIMPREYQWLRLDGDKNPDAIIMHWTGPVGKSHIRKLMGGQPITNQVRSLAKSKPIYRPVARPIIRPVVKSNMFRQK